MTGRKKLLLFAYIAFYKTSIKIFRKKTKRLKHKKNGEPDKIKYLA